MASGTIKKTISGFGADSTFTLPKTFTHDAMVNIVLTLKSVSGAAAYYYVRRNGSAICAAFLGTANGGTQSLCFPIRNGDTISLYSSGNVDSVTLYEFPIV